MSNQPEIERLSRLIQFPTVAPRIGEDKIKTAFGDLFHYIQSAYPILFANATVRKEEPWNLVVEIPGTAADLDPVLLLAHYDVVDVPEQSEKDWRYPPFSGTVAEGYVWGRGALDDKNCFAAILEAAERILASPGVQEGDRTLRRGLVLAFGGDEELMGGKGAGRIAARFREEARRFYFSLDEGSVVASGLLSQPELPIAMIGLSEKGYADLRIVAEGSGGHSSMPPASTALGEVARAIARVEKNPFPQRQIPTVRRFFTHLGNETKGPLGFVYRHAAFLWPAVRRILSQSTQTNALTRTTQAVTMATGSSAPNVLPQHAQGVVNLRLLPGDTIGSALLRLRRLLSNLNVTVELVDEAGCHEAAPEAPIDHPAYGAIAEGVRKMFSDAVVVPFLVLGATDSKWYTDLTEGSYRFVPLLLDSGEISTIHGTNERIRVDGYLGMIDFYEELVRRVCEVG